MSTENSPWRPRALMKLGQLYGFCVPIPRVIDELPRRIEDDFRPIFETIIFRERSARFVIIAVTAEAFGSLRSFAVLYNHKSRNIITTLPDDDNSSRRKLSTLILRTETWAKSLTQSPFEDGHGFLQPVFEDRGPTRVPGFVETGRFRRH